MLAKTMILTLSIAALALSSGRAEADEPALEPTDSGCKIRPADVSLPGMLHGKILRSPHPHARIKRVDFSRATQMGACVLSYDDVPDTIFNLRQVSIPRSTYKDWQVLSSGGAPAESSSGLVALNGTLGQTAIGPSAATHGSLGGGFWYGAGARRYEIYMPVVLRNS